MDRNTFNNSKDNHPSGGHNKDNLRIGIEVQRLFREKKHGMEVVALELIRELQYLDERNEYILFVKDDIDNTCVEETSNFKIHKIPSAPYPVWEQLSLPAATRKSGVDFLHSTCNTSALRPGVPLLLTLHDIIYLEQTDFKGTTYQNFGNLYRKWVVPPVVRNSELVITVSAYEKKVIMDKLGLPDEKIRVIYNAVSEKFNVHYTQKQLEYIKDRYRLPKEFILFLGNTAPKKNTANVIRAYIVYLLANTTPLPLVLLDYDKALVSGQLETMGQGHLIGHFIFPGYVQANEMPLLYNLATLFLYPSLRESFGLPLLEAMACGTPVITSNTSSMPEIAGGAALLVDPNHPEEIAAGITLLLSNDELRGEFCEKGLKQAARFTWRSSAASLLEIYSSFKSKIGKR